MTVAQPSRHRLLFKPSTIAVGSIHIIDQWLVWRHLVNYPGNLIGPELQQKEETWRGVRHIELTFLPGVVSKWWTNYFRLNQLAPCHAVTSPLAIFLYCVWLHCNVVQLMGQLPSPLSFDEWCTPDWIKFEKIFWCSRIARKTQMKMEGNSRSSDSFNIKHDDLEWTDIQGWE